MPKFSEFTSQASPADTDQVVGLRSTANSRFTLTAIKALFQSVANTAGKAAQRDTDGSVDVAAVNLDTAASPTAQEGQVRWNDARKCVEFCQADGMTVEVGRELPVRARNTTGSPLTRGTPVYVSGANGTHPTIARADADAFATAGNLLGLVKDSSLADNSDGEVVVMGVLEDANTAAFTNGATLYLSDGTSGTLTATKPTATSSFVVRVGYVLRSHTSQGVILVSPAFFGSTIGDSLSTATSQANARSIIDAAPTTHTHTASQISDSTSVGRSVLTAATQAAANTAIGSIPASTLGQPGGPARFEVSLTGKQVWVDSVNGNDAIGLRGRRDRPFLTLTAAQVAASAGDTVFVLPGAYSDHSLGKNGVNWYLFAGATVEFNGDASGSPEDIRYIFGDAPGGVSAPMSFSILGAGRIRCIDDEVGGAYTYGCRFVNAGTFVTVEAKEIYASEELFSFNRGTGLSVVGATVTCRVETLHALGQAVEVESGQLNLVADLVSAEEEHAIGIYGGSFYAEISRVTGPGNDAIYQTAGASFIDAKVVTCNDGAAVFVSDSANMSLRALRAVSSVGHALAMNGGSGVFDIRDIVTTANNEPAVSLNGGTHRIVNARIHGSGTNCPAIALSSSGLSLQGAVLVATASNSITVTGGTPTLKVVGSCCANVAVAGGITQQVGTVTVSANVA